MRSDPSAIPWKITPQADPETVGHRFATVDGVEVYITRRVAPTDTGAVRTYNVHTDHSSYGTISELADGRWTTVRFSTVANFERKYWKTRDEGVRWFVGLRRALLARQSSNQG